MKAFEGKVVIVTGASSGIGEAAALKFAQEGANVVVAARREDRGRAVVNRINSSGAKGLFVQTDVSVGAQVERLVKKTLEAFGRLDCAVNNAGISGPVATPIADIEDDDWDAVMNTNLRAVWLCMKHEIRAMQKTGKGAIVNVSSVYGYRPSDMGHAPYCASKYGVIGLSKTAAIDYAAAGIRVNVVAPGYTRSEIVDPYLEAAPKLMKILLSRYSSMNRVAESSETAEA
ncbi:MAG: SDR family NAD(P)-dependent oxidoreductase, partial [Candidatus Hydrogenedentes bacterium]|nr:SDR family NAD(P)-dependent oxidoreductase [Candidatus Hydrogenedentota bacterium]